MKMKTKVKSMGFFLWALVLSIFGMSTMTSQVNAQETTDVNLVVSGAVWWLTIGQSWALNMWSVSVSSTGQTLESQFTWTSFFWLDDLIGSNSGYYTTISLTNLSGQNTSAFIPNTNVEIKVDSASAILETWSANSSVVVGSGAEFTSYRVFDTIFTFINRPVGANNGLLGKYKTFPWLRVTIPAYQAIDSYKGIITYTLYDW